MNHHSKFITNLRYPFYFEDVHDQENEEAIRVSNITLYKIKAEFIDPGIFERANNKAISKWKEVCKTDFFDF